MIKGNLSLIGSTIRTLELVQTTQKERLGADVAEVHWTFEDDENAEIEHVISWAIRPAKHSE